jgi:hypothetical protein
MRIRGSGVFIQIQSMQLLGPAKLHRCSTALSGPSQSSGLFGMTPRRGAILFDGSTRWTG